MQKLVTVYDALNLDPHVLNREIRNLPDLLTEHVPDELQYACRHWAEHLTMPPLDEEVFKAVESLFFERLFHWLATLSLVSAVGVAIPSISKAKGWIEVSLRYCRIQSSQH